MSILPFLKAAGPILSGLGGLFGKKKTTTRTNFKQLRDDAEDAGYNALTALRATGGAGNTTTSHPALSSMEFLGNAMTGIGQAFDPMQRERDQLELDLMRAELGRLKSPALGSGYNANIPQVDPNRPDLGLPTGVYFGGANLKPNEAFSDADALSQRYGEIVEMLGGLVVLGGDTYKWFDDKNRALFKPSEDHTYKPQNYYETPALTTGAWSTGFMGGLMSQ